VQTVAPSHREDTTFASVKKAPLWGRLSNCGRLPIRLARLNCGPFSSETIAFRRLSRFFALARSKHAGPRKTLACPTLFLLAAGALAAQTVDIYSEFSRIDPFGAIVPADRGAPPREILSPAVARNAWASFHIAISAPPRTTYLLYVATNPLDACRVAMYREHFEKTSAGWVPDRLTELTRLPDFGVMPDPDDGVEGQTTRAYLLDLWIPPDAPVSRFRLEVQLKVGYWVVRPMEVRIIAPRVPDLREASGGPPLPPVASGADAPALGALRADNLRTYPPPETVRAIIRRNAIQDAALASTLDPAVRETLRARAAALMLDGGLHPRAGGVEWYLRLRGWIYAQAQQVATSSPPPDAAPK